MHVRFGGNPSIDTCGQATSSPDIPSPSFLYQSQRCRTDKRQNHNRPPCLRNILVRNPFSHIPRQESQRVEAMESERPGRRELDRKFDESRKAAKTPGERCHRYIDAEER
jgi:hypothetical protein